MISYFSSENNKNKENKNSDNIFENIQNDCERITNQIIFEIKNFVKKKMEKTDIIYLHKLSDQMKLNSNKKILEYLKENVIKNLFEKYSKCLTENKLNTYFNVLVTGQSGVGKTTLISEILSLNKNNVDNDNKPYGNYDFTSTAYPFLKLWDTRGIELKNFTIEDCIDFNINFIKTKIDINQTQNIINCIWFCITGTRIAPIEITYIKKLLNVYNIDKNYLPIIIIYTKCVNKKISTEIKNCIFKNFTEDELKFIKFTSIMILEKEVTLANKKITISPFGKDKLIEYTNSFINIGFKSTSIYYIYKEMLSYLSTSFVNHNYNVIFDKINYDIDYMFNNFENSMNVQDQNIQMLSKEYFNLFANFFITENEFKEFLNYNKSIFDKLIDFSVEWINSHQIDAQKEFFNYDTKLKEKIDYYINLMIKNNIAYYNLQKSLLKEILKDMKYNIFYEIKCKNQILFFRYSLQYIMINFYAKIKDNIFDNFKEIIQMPCTKELINKELENNNFININEIINQK